MSLVLNERYLIDQSKLVGSGAFSKVFLGKEMRTGEPLAIKAIKKNSDIQFYENALNQIQILKLLKHKNIVAIKEVIDTKHTLYVVMEYCHGITLDKYLKAHGKLTENQSISIFNQLLEAMEHILDKNIMHRDIKPANIVYGNGKVKLIDFGFAAVFQELYQQIPDQLGTPLYMSPQILSRTKYTTKSDIWSLGVLLYQMLYGTIPWRAKSPSQLLKVIQKNPVQFPQIPLVSLNTKLLIKECLKIPQDWRLGWQKLFQKNQSTLRKSKSKIELISKNHTNHSQVNCGFFC